MGKPGGSDPGPSMVASVLAATAFWVAPLWVAPLAAPAWALVAQTTEPSGWVTLSQRVEVDMGAGDGSAEVDVLFELASAREGAPAPIDEPVPLELLGFGDATAEEVVVNGVESVVLWPTVGSHRAARVRLPADRSTPTVEVAVSYRVGNVLEAGEAGSAPATTDDPSIHARIPILTGPPVRAESGGEAFGARLSTPEGWALTEGFPSGLREVEPGRHVVSLTVAPSVVGFRARTDGSWRPGFPLVVDVLTVLILSGFAAFGWRHLRSVAA